MKRANLLFFCLLIYCCIQGRGNSERHWYWVPRDPMRVTPQLSNEHVFLHLSSKCVTGLEVTLGSALLCKKKNKKWNATMLQGTGCVHTWAFTARTVFSFKALELWRKEIWKIISHVPASLPRPAKNCVFLKGRNKLLPHILFFFIAFLDAVCSAMGQFTLGLKPWQHLIYSALLQNNVRTGQNFPDHWTATLWALNSLEWKCI